MEYVEYALMESRTVVENRLIGSRVRRRPYILRRGGVALRACILLVLDL